MKLVKGKLERSFAALLLLGAAFWSFNISAYNWWVAGFHGEYWHGYASRGDKFFVLAILLACGFVFVVVSIFRMKSRD